LSADNERAKHASVVPHTQGILGKVVKVDATERLVEKRHPKIATLRTPPVISGTPNPSNNPY